MGASPHDIVLDRPRRADHGHVTTSVALKLTHKLDRPSHGIAQDIVAALEFPPSVVARVEIAGPGFINFWLADAAFDDVLASILAEGHRYGRGNDGRQRRVTVEFPAADPNSPLLAMQGRIAVVGEVISALLEAAGYVVTRELGVANAQSNLAQLTEHDRDHEELGVQFDIVINETRLLDEGFVEATVADLESRQVLEQLDPALRPDGGTVSALLERR